MMHDGDRKANGSAARPARRGAGRTGSDARTRRSDGHAWAPWAQGQNRTRSPLPWGPSAAYRRGMIAGALLLVVAVAVVVVLASLLGGGGG
jgi:hypothetical protein